MAIHFNKASGRFKDDRGRFVSKSKAMRSSIARREYAEATAPKPAHKAKRPAKSAPKAPWIDEGLIKEHPEPGEWFDEAELYGYDDLIDDWGDYADEGIDS